MATRKSNTLTEQQERFIAFPIIDVKPKRGLSDEHKKAISEGIKRKNAERAAAKLEQEKQVSETKVHKKCNPLVAQTIDLKKLPKSTTNTEKPIYIGINMVTFDTVICQGTNDTKLKGFDPSAVRKASRGIIPSYKGHTWTKHYV